MRSTAPASPCGAPSTNNGGSNASQCTPSCDWPKPNARTALRVGGPVAVQPPAGTRDRVNAVPAALRFVPARVLLKLEFRAEPLPGEQVGRLGEENRLPVAPPLGEIQLVLAVLLEIRRTPGRAGAHPRDAVGLAEDQAAFLPMHAIRRCGHRDIVPLAAGPSQIEQVVGPRVMIQPGVPHCARLATPRRVEHDLVFAAGHFAHRVGIGAVQPQPPVGDAGTAHQLSRRKHAPGVTRRAVLESPLGQRRRVGQLVGPQRGDRLRVQCPIVNPRLVDRPAKEPDGPHPAQVPQAEQHRRVGTERPRLVDRGSWHTGGRHDRSRRGRPPRPSRSGRACRRWPSRPDWPAAPVRLACAGKSRCPPSTAPAPVRRRRGRQSPRLPSTSTHCPRAVPCRPDRPRRPGFCRSSRNGGRRGSPPCVAVATTVDSTTARIANRRKAPAQGVVIIAFASDARGLVLLRQRDCGWRQRPEPVRPFHKRTGRETRGEGMLAGESQQRVVDLAKRRARECWAKE